MILKLLENVAWSLFFVVFLYIYTGAFTILGIYLEERIGTLWATIIIVFLNVAILSTFFTLVFGVPHV